MWTTREILAIADQRRSTNHIDLDPAPTLEEIAQSERRLGIRFPQALKQWLAVCNGAHTTFGDLYGVPTSTKGGRGTIEAIATMWNDAGWLQRGWIPIANDGCGNFYVIAYDHGTRDYAVAFIDTMENPQTLSYAVASSLLPFVAAFFLKDINLEIPASKQVIWPFDEYWVRENDPALFEVTVAALPWTLS